MVCKACGTENAKDSVYCTLCGTEFFSEGIEQSSASSDTSAVTPKKEVSTSSVNALELSGIILSISSLICYFILQYFCCGIPLLLSWPLAVTGIVLSIMALAKSSSAHTSKTLAVTGLVTSSVYLTGQVLQLIYDLISALITNLLPLILSGLITFLDTL